MANFRHSTFGTEVTNAFALAVGRGSRRVHKLDGCDVQRFLSLTAQRAYLLRQTPGVVSARGAVERITVQYSLGPESITELGC